MNIKQTNISMLPGNEVWETPFKAILSLLLRILKRHLLPPDIHRWLRSKLQSWKKGKSIEFLFLQSLPEAPDTLQRCYLPLHLGEMLSTGCNWKEIGNIRVFCNMKNIWDVLKIPKWSVTICSSDIVSTPSILIFRTQFLSPPSAFREPTAYRCWAQVPLMMLLSESPSVNSIPHLPWHSITLNLKPKWKHLLSHVHMLPLPDCTCSEELGELHQVNVGEGTDSRGRWWSSGPRVCLPSVQPGGESCLLVPGPQGSRRMTTSLSDFPFSPHQHITGSWRASLETNTSFVHTEENAPC